MRALSITVAFFGICGLLSAMMAYPSTATRLPTGAFRIFLLLYGSSALLAAALLWQRSRRAPKFYLLWACLVIGLIIQVSAGALGSVRPARILADVLVASAAIVPGYVFARRQVEKPAKQAQRGRG
jgi:uncharacterized membrane protein